MSKTLINKIARAFDVEVKRGESESRTAQRLLNHAERLKRAESDAKERTISAQEYYTEVRRIAADCLAEAEGDTGLALDLARQTVDGHSWIIYTHYSLLVLQHSRNESAYEDTGSELKGGFAQVMTYMAYCAMELDVVEALNEVSE